MYTKHYLVEWLIDMVAQQWLFPRRKFENKQLFGSQGWMSQALFIIHQNSKEVVSNFSERTNLPELVGQADKQQEIPSSVSIYTYTANRKCGPDLSWVLLWQVVQI